MCVIDHTPLDDFFKKTNSNILNVKVKMVQGLNSYNENYEVNLLKNECKK